MRLPLAAVALGVLGLIPFVASGVLSVTGDPTLAPRALLALIGYGAVILSFLGGVHWGFALPVVPPPVVPSVGARLVLGVAPSLVGWGAVVLAAWRWDEIALLVLIAGFIGTMIGEARAHRRGLMPPGYIWLRWGLTAGVLICLVSVAILHALGGNIVL